MNNDRVVTDVGCGTGRHLAKLAATYGPPVRFIGVEPAENMRMKAVGATQSYPHVDVRDGAFEQLPIDSHSVDYLYSFYAFHWATDLETSIRELARVLSPAGRMNLVFTGRHNGKEFLRITTPIYLKYMGPTALLRSALRRKQLTKEAAGILFAAAFPSDHLVVHESYETYYDSLEGHWSWWVRAEGHFVDMPREQRERCDRDIKAGLMELVTDKGIPYTIHSLHVRITPPTLSESETAPPPARR
ncbi:MAG TPA: class I SAM-dependent methyltransferase [Nitrospira sp.]|nr:class I SAM-dependent methyltransferase [Nitrospira sp.]